nr:discoidin domain-containing protein [Streptosporangium subroseum]
MKRRIVLPTPSPTLLSQPWTATFPRVGRRAWACPDPSWMQVDLGSVTSVSSVVTMFEKPSGYKYLLEYSSDGTNRSTFDDHTASYTAPRRTSPSPRRRSPPATCGSP